jgi:ribonuclease III
LSEQGRDTLAELVEALPGELRRQALTHPSWTKKRVDSYERLAYLGDSMLALTIASDLWGRFAKVDVGRLTKIHNQAVSGASCAEVGRELGVPEMLAAAEPQREGAIPTEVLLTNERPLPEATEALIGACFLAFGFERTAAAVAAAFEPHVEYAAKTSTDFKSALQELLARRKARVVYNVVDEGGVDHRRVFEVEAIVDCEQVGRGRGRSKKAAEQAAAEEALKRFGG